MDEFEKALKEETFKEPPDEALHCPACGFEKGIAHGARWAREWFLNNSSYLNKCYIFAMKSNKKLQAENAKLKKALGWKQKKAESK